LSFVLSECLLKLVSPEQRKALYADYRDAQREMRKAVAVITNIDHLLGVTDGRENKAQER